MNRRHVAIIDNSLDPAVYTPVAHWNKYLPRPGVPFRAPEGSFPDLDSGAFSHLILTGSEASIMERESWVDEEVDFVRRAVDRGLAVLGSCYGHQLLALALSGPESVSRCPTPELGWLPIQIKRANPLLGKKQGVYMFTLHFDEVVNLDSDFQVVAGTPLCPVHAFQLAGKPVWGIQAHPEIDEEDGRQLLRNLLESDSPHAPLFRSALRSQTRDSGLIRFLVGNFLDMNCVL